MSEISFTPLRGGGEWLKGRDFIEGNSSPADGHLVLILSVIDSWEVWNELRNENGKAVKINMVDLDTGAVYNSVNWSDKHIVRTLEVGDSNILARVCRLAPKQKGWQGAIVLQDASGDMASVSKAIDWINSQKPTFNPPAQKAEKPKESVVDPLAEALTI